MKKLLLVILAAVAAFFLSSPAYADSVRIYTQGRFNTSPGGTSTSEIYKDLAGTSTVSFQVAGKTCNLKGSQSTPGAYQGCNYSITVGPDGSITGTGNTPCSQASEIAQLCR